MGLSREQAERVPDSLALLPVSVLTQIIQFLTFLVSTPPPSCSFYRIQLLHLYPFLVSLVHLLLQYQILPTRKLQRELGDE